MSWEDAVEDSQRFCFTFLLFLFHQGHGVSYPGFGSYFSWSFQENVSGIIPFWGKCCAGLTETAGKFG